MKTAPATLLRLAPLLLAALALVLRVWGIDWGLPNQSRLWSYHVDESLVVGSSHRVNPFALQLDTGFYNYGEWYLLAVGALLHAGESIGLIPPPLDGVAPSAGGLLAARLLTVLLGVATSLLLWRAGRRLFNPTVGLAAGCLYAVAPLAVQHGHFATVDVPATFWIALSLAGAATHLEAPGRLRALALAGAAAGLAAATKYNAGLILLSGIAAWWLGSPRSPKALALLLGATAAGFLVGCPGALLNFARFQKDLLYEAGHMGAGSENLFVGTAPGWVHHVTSSLYWGLGAPLTALALAGCVAAGLRRRPGDALLAAFALPYYLLIGAAQVKFARYCLPLFPPLLLWSAALLLHDKRRLASGALALAGVCALGLAGAFNHAFAGPDPRDTAAAAIRAAGIAKVGFARRPWFWSPPLAPQLSHYSPALAYRSLANWTGSPALAAPDLDQEWSVEFLETNAPDALALSELEYADILRLDDPRASQYVRRASELYPHRDVFTTPVALFGVTLAPPRTLDEMPVQGLPHDMLYPNPTVVVLSK